VLLKTKTWEQIVQFSMQQKRNCVTGQIGFPGWELLWISVIHIALGPNLVFASFSEYFQSIPQLPVA
jgi:hypothetical protein